MKHILLFMASMVMLLHACSPGKDNQPQKTTVAADGLAKDLETTQLEREHGTEPDTTTSGNYQLNGYARKNNAIPYLDWNKKIIKTAEIKLELTNYQAYDRKLHDGLKSFGAFIANEEQSRGADKIMNDITIKVPVEQFENLVTSFGGEGVNVLQKKISTNDVTTEVIDTRTRIESKKQVRDRYLHLLNKAGNMKEILQVQQEVNSVQEEIEAAAGRVNYLGHQSAYSTIHLQYFQVTGITAPVENNGFFVKLENGFNTGVRLVGNVLVLAVTIWPLLLIAVIVWLLFRKKENRSPVN